MKALFDQVSFSCSKITTQSYSTSFSLGIKFLKKDIQEAIYGIYGFVRFADEIVDSFHGYKQEELLHQFWDEVHQAIKNRISLNPILNCFQHIVNEYSIDRELIDAFMKSMAIDLQKIEYDSDEEYQDYIYGSAEVVGLMCLKVFCKGDHLLYEKLTPQARRLGSAFQKVNFLRDIKADYDQLGRFYFPNLSWAEFNEESKRAIEHDIQTDFDEALLGIKQLPKNSRFGVYLAYTYYTRLFKKIKNTKANKILNKRIRIPNAKKYYLFLNSYVKHQSNQL